MVKRIPPYKCSKVLPLVYDESLSYYEAICKMTEKINDLIDYVQTYVLPTIDTEMSDTSEHPVQNKVIKEYVDSQSGNIIDTEMSDTSENAVQNKVIKEYVDNHTPTINVDTEMSSTSENAVQNKVIKEYVDNSAGAAYGFDGFTISNGSGSLDIADYISERGKPNSYQFTIAVTHTVSGNNYSAVVSATLDNMFTTNLQVPVPIVDSSGNLVTTYYVNISNAMPMSYTKLDIEMINYDATHVTNFSATVSYGIKNYL